MLVFVSAGKERVFSGSQLFVAEIECDRCLQSRGVVHPHAPGLAGLDHFVKAIVLVRLGRDGEAKAELKKGLEINPAITQTKWREINFYSDPKILDNEVADLAKAGLPEK